MRRARVGFWLLTLVHASCATKSSPPLPTPSGQAWLAPNEIAQGNVKMAPLAETEVGAQVVTSGRVTFDDLRISHVMSPVTGRVVGIKAALGQHVRRGETLAVLESPDIGVSSSDLDKAKADLTAAESDWRRQQHLLADHAASQRDFETAQDNFDRARAEFARAIDKAKLLSHGDNGVEQHYALSSLIDGEVLARNVHPGVEIVGQYSGGSASELFTIGSLDDVWVLADVFESDLGRVVHGQKVTVTVPAYPSETFVGTVDYVSSTLDSNTRTATVRCVIQNRQNKLKPEMLATVRIASRGQFALTVPRSSIVRLGDKTVVFVLAQTGSDGRLRFERRPVIVDEPEDETDAPAVLHGLAPGETVVTAGAQLISQMMI